MWHALLLQQTATASTAITANKLANTNQNKTDKNTTKTKTLNNERKLKGTNELYICNDCILYKYIHITSVIYDKCRYMHTENRMKSEQ